MTGIQTIHIQGIGGQAELRGPVLEADYQPGAFELAELAVCTAACGVALLGVALGVVLGAQDPALGLLCDAAGAVCLLGAFAAWRSAVRSLRTRGARRIQLARGWVERGNEIRHLRDATPRLEELRVGRWAYARLVLRFPDGLDVPVLQGPVARVAAFAHAVHTAPSRRPAARPVRAAA